MIKEGCFECVPMRFGCILIQAADLFVKIDGTMAVTAICLKSKNKVWFHLGWLIFY